MKTVAKVFLRLTIVLYVILAIFLACFLAYLFDSGAFFLLIIFVFMLPIALASAALARLENAKSKRELLVISILVLLFSDLLAGIFMLCITDEDLIENKTRSGATCQSAPRHHTENAPIQTTSTMQCGATTARPQTQNAPRQTTSTVQCGATTAGPQTQNAPRPTSAPSISNELATKLNDAKIMYEDGILTEDEYKDIRKKIISYYF